MTLRAILFDLGNVVIHFDASRMYAQLSEVSGLSVEDLHQIAQAQGVHKEFEHGRLTVTQMVEKFLDKAPRRFEEQDFVHAFCDVFTLNDKVVGLLPALRSQDLRLVIVSNTNAAHMQWAKARYSYFAQFDAEILSHEVGFMKPHKRFYELAEAGAGCRPEEALFVDDLEPNCRGAREHGFWAHQYSDHDRFLEELSSRGVVV